MHQKRSKNRIHEKNIYTTSLDIYTCMQKLLGNTRTYMYKITKYVLMHTYLINSKLFGISSGI